jgi:hypothetical protein
MIEKNPKVEVWAIPAPKGGSRAFCDRMNSWAQKEGQPGLGYIFWREEEGALEGAGPIAKNIGPERTEAIRTQLGLEAGDAVFFAAGEPSAFASFAGKARDVVGQELGLFEENVFRFCWIVDFPMYEWDEDNKKVDFSHNPFSMPQMDPDDFMALDKDDHDTLLGMKAWQYDIICNGIELSSGAIRNHRPDVMLKAFEFAGYGEDVVEEAFGGMLNAFRYGAPPHGGIAPGVDRIVMILADQDNLREVVMFPKDQQARDLMMNAPAPAEMRQLRELHLRTVTPEAKKDSYFQAAEVVVAAGGVHSAHSRSRRRSSARWAASCWRRVCSAACSARRCSASCCRLARSTACSMRRASTSASSACERRSGCLGGAGGAPSRVMGGSDGFGGWTALFQDQTNAVAEFGGMEVETPVYLIEITIGLSFRQSASRDAQAVAHRFRSGLFDRHFDAVRAFAFIDADGDVLRRMAQIGQRFAQGERHFTFAHARDLTTFSDGGFKLGAGAFQFGALAFQIRHLWHCSLGTATQGEDQAPILRAASQRVVKGQARILIAAHMLEILRRQTFRIAQIGGGQIDRYELRI